LKLVDKLDSSALPPVQQGYSHPCTLALYEAMLLAVARWERQKASADFPSSPSMAVDMDTRQSSE
jgi:hypothetical protein